MRRNHRVGPIIRDALRRKAIYTYGTIISSSGVVWLPGLENDWPLNETGVSPEDAIDLQENADLTHMMNPPSRNVTGLGDCRAFDVSNQYFYATKASVPHLYGGADFSIAGWINHDTDVADTVCGVYATTGNQRCWYLRQRFDGTFQLFGSSNGSTDVNTTIGDPISAGTNTHIVLTWDEAAEEFELWVDGVSKGTLSVVGGLFDSTANFNLGARDSGTDTFDGVVSRWRTWSIKIPEEYITALASELS